MKWLISLLRFHLLNIALRPNSMPSLINLIKFLNNHKKKLLWVSWNNSINNRKILNKDWFLSTQKHCAYKKLLKWSMKYQSIFYHNSLYSKIISLKFLHHLTRIWNRWVWPAEFRQKKSNLNQHLKILLIRSRLIVLKVSPSLPWIYHISLWTKTIHFLNI